MSLGIYNISRPSTGRNTGMTPTIPADYITPRHARPAPFDPATITLEGNSNYLGSRKLRASTDQQHIKVRNLLDEDAVVNGSKIWHRETEYMNTGNIRLGPIADSKVYRYHEVFHSTAISPTPSLVQVDSSDSVASTSSTSTDGCRPQTPLDEHVIVFGTPSHAKK